MKKGKLHTLEVATELVAEAFKKQFPGASIERVAGAGTPENARWFKALFSGPADFSLYITLSSATESPSANIEQVFQEFARMLSATVGARIWCSAVTEEAPLAPASTVRYELLMDKGPAGEVIVSLPESTIEALTRDIPFSPFSESARPLDVLMNIDLPVTISFGSVEIPLGDVLKLTTGSIVELNHRLNEPVDIVVNRCLVARGEVVVVDGNYGVRVSEVCRSSA